MSEWYDLIDFELPAARDFTVETCLTVDERLPEVCLCSGRNCALVAFDVAKTLTPVWMKR